MPDGYDDLKALFLNCSIKYDAAQSHTRRLIARSAGIMASQGVEIEVLHVLDHEIAFGMVKDATTESGRPRDDWPGHPGEDHGRRHPRHRHADLARDEVERVDARHRADVRVQRRSQRRRGSTSTTGRRRAAVVTGNEDGVKACAMELLYAMAHIGYTIPPQPDCGWIGEAGPGASYGDVVDGKDVPVGYDNDFTMKNCTIMSWNLMHTARRLKDAGGLPTTGNRADHWEEDANARQQDPERTNF